jgi:hypothetical protein
MEPASPVRVLQSPPATLEAVVERGWIVAERGLIIIWPSDSTCLCLRITLHMRLRHPVASP